MKKIYITPSIFCVKINTRSAMLQSSITKGAGEFDPSEMSFVKEYDSSSDGGSSSGSVWDEEW